MKTATQEIESRLDEQQRQRQYAMLGRYENQRARAIAMHYVRNALNAQQLLAIIKLSRESLSQDADEIIAALVQDIAKNHAKDLGIKLEWEEAP
jgi:hypothetical protein